jgi:outer membrane lipoprotein LolB
MKGSIASAAALTLVALLQVSGCATVPAKPALTTWDERAANLPPAREWHAQGRVAVASAREGFAGGFDWREGLEHSDINVRGPIGIGGLSITRQDQEVRIATSKGEVFVSQSPDSDLEARLGVPLPISYLRYWMTGQPAPAPAPQPQPGTVGFEQSGWSVSYEQFDGTMQLPLPSRMTAVREATRIRVVVDHWDYTAQ